MLFRIFKKFDRKAILHSTHRSTSSLINHQVQPKRTRIFLDECLILQGDDQILTAFYGVTLTLSVSSLFYRSRCRFMYKDVEWTWRDQMCLLTQPVAAVSGLIRLHARRIMHFDYLIWQLGDYVNVCVVAFVVSIVLKRRNLATTANHHCHFSRLM